MRFLSGLQNIKYNKRVKIEDFRKIIRDFYEENRRILPWRETDNSYYILVSEIMLQQTQVVRVLKKYPEFIFVFTTIQSLADAPLSRILKIWQGMGYNRRALYLKKTAEIIVKKYNGVIPDDIKILQSFPGIGYNTACSIAAFAFHKPTVFIETNIRRVFIYHYSSEVLKDQKISDNDILPLVEKTLDRKNPREWYYALMDYGSFLAKQGENPNRKSKQHVIQSKFEGSDRQIRGKILKLLLKKPLRQSQIAKHFSHKPERVYSIIENLREEGFVREERGKYGIK